MVGGGLDSSCSGQGAVVGSFQHDSGGSGIYWRVKPLLYSE